MPGFDDLPQEVRDLKTSVSQAVTGAVSGTTTPTSGAGRVDEVAETALVMCYRYAPDAPAEVMREAGVRCAAWLIGSKAHARSERKADPSGAAQEIQFQNQSATPNALRNSGALSLLSPYKVRRGGAI